MCIKQGQIEVQLEPPRLVKHKVKPRPSTNIRHQAAGPPNYYRSVQPQTHRPTPNMYQQAAGMPGHHGPSKNQAFQPLGKASSLA